MSVIFFKARVFSQPPSATYTRRTVINLDDLSPIETKPLTKPTPAYQKQCLIEYIFNENFVQILSAGSSPCSSPGNWLKKLVLFLIGVYICCKRKEYPLVIGFCNKYINEVNSQSQIKYIVLRGLICTLLLYFSLDPFHTPGIPSDSAAVNNTVMYSSAALQTTDRSSCDCIRADSWNSSNSHFKTHGDEFISRLPNWFH